MSSVFDLELQELRAKRHAEYEKTIADREASKGKSPDASAQSHSSIPTTKSSAGGHGGGASSLKSPDRSEESGSGVEIVQPGAGEHEGSGSKRKSPDRSAGDGSNAVIVLSDNSDEENNSDVEIVEPGADRHGSSADKTMQEDSKQDYVCKTNLRLRDPRDVDIAGTECPEVVVYLYASQTCTIKVETEIPREHLFISNTPQIQCGFCEEQPIDFIITAKSDAILQNGPEQVLFYHKETDEKIGTVSVNIRVSAVVGSGKN